MKLVASLGDRNGHTGIFPLDPGNQRAFHEYPYLVYEFADGVYVIGQLDGDDLIGARLTAVGGIPIDQVLAQVKPLVPHDNETTGVELFRPMYLLNEEVLDGLGIAPQFGFTLPNGDEVERTPTAVSAARIRRRSTGSGRGCGRTAPSMLRERHRATRVAMLADGRVVYLAYNTTTVYTSDVASRVARLASKPKVRRVVVDLRNNLGGDNNTYPPLIAALQRLARKHKRIVVLAGRSTFSAAANFMADLETATRYLLVGEDSGGAPNLYGDVQPLDLPATGLRVEVARIWWVKSKLGATIRASRSTRIRRAADGEGVVRRSRSGARGGADRPLLEGSPRALNNYAGGRGEGSARGIRAPSRARRGARGRRRRPGRAPCDLPLADPVAHVRRALGRLPPPGPDRDVRDLLEPRGDAGRLGARARRRRLDLPELPRVGDRPLARHAGERPSSTGGAAIPPAGGTPPITASRRSACRSRRTSRTPSASRGARS